jgi:hypothetical protein
MPPSPLLAVIAWGPWGPMWASSKALMIASACGLQLRPVLVGQIARLLSCDPERGAAPRPHQVHKQFAGHLRVDLFPVVTPPRHKVEVVVPDVKVGRGLSVIRSAPIRAGSWVVANVHRLFSMALEPITVGEIVAFAFL